MSPQEAQRLCAILAPYGWQVVYSDFNSPHSAFFVARGPEYSAVNISVDPAFLPCNGCSIEEFTKAANARAAFVARLLFEDGFTVFSAVKPVSGRHIIRNVGQVCILHKEGARDAAIAS